MAWGFSFNKRVDVRAEYPVIDEHYHSYLLQFYEEIYYPDAIVNADRAAYVERNCHMIDQSDFCVLYYDAANAPDRRKSGTKLALAYAQTKKKSLFLFPVL